MGPSVSGLVGAMKPLPARLHPSLFMSTKAPDAPADVGSALRTIWLTSSSPSSYVEPLAHVPCGLWLSVQVVDSSGVESRNWIPFASGLPFPSVRTIFPLKSFPAPVGVQSAAGGSSFVFTPPRHSEPGWPL